MLAYFPRGSPIEVADKLARSASHFRVELPQMLNIDRRLLLAAGLK